MNVPVIPESAPFTAEQRAWLNGYLAGLFAREDFNASAATGDTKQLHPLTILYGTQTGTAESLAKQTAKLAGSKQFVANVVDMASATAEMLAGAKNIFIITSTYGEGDPPDNAKDFWDTLSAENFPKLTGIPFSVFALGDTNYEKFCQFGKDLDLRLEALGAKRIYDRIDADTDYEQSFQTWCSGALGALSGVAIEGGIHQEPESETYSKKNPFPARLKTNRKLSLAGSEKDTRHFEIMLDDSIIYEPGDALGVIPQYNPAHDLGPNPKKIQPRLYSISSSPKAHPNEVHLTVSVVRYVLDGVAREGLCSTFLADRVGDGLLPVYVHKNSTFRLPQDTTKPIIMVGPGTGVAPFRAFLEERRAIGATGKNILFFGEQRSASDFYYQDELEAMGQDNFLTLHTAFSRDQKEKIYVQQRMIENAQQIYGLLEEGAFFYVCGDASRMAKDVDAALHKVIEGSAGISTEAAAEYVKKLRSAKRYVRDVY